MEEKSNLFSVLRRPKVWVPLLLFVLAIGVLAVLARQYPDTSPAQEAVKRGLKYDNQGLGFSMVLPEEYLYFQTQSKNGASFKDIEIFVPTADTQYPQEVPGYAKSIVVRVYERKTWDETPADSGEKSDFRYIGIKNDKAYALKLWEKIPKDWNNKWNSDLEKFILDNFKLL